MLRVAIIEQETDFLLRDLKAVEDSYGTDILIPTMSCRYIERLLENGRVERPPQQVHMLHPAILPKGLSPFFLTRKDF